MGNVGLLALFFFVAGLELKRELLLGELSHLTSPLLPVLAALGGVVVPAAVAAINVAALLAAVALCLLYWFACRPRVVSASAISRPM